MAHPLAGLWRTFILVFPDSLPLGLEGFHPLSLLSCTLGIHNIPFLFVPIAHLPCILDCIATIDHLGGGRKEREGGGGGGGEGGGEGEVNIILEKLYRDGLEVHYLRHLGDQQSHSCQHTAFPCR